MCLIFRSVLRSLYKLCNGSFCTFCVFERAPSIFSVLRTFYYFGLAYCFLSFIPAGTFYASTILNEPLGFLGFVHSETFYASVILNKPLAFWASFLQECFMLLRFQMSPLLLGFIPFETFYASVIFNE
jgi:hypothetical protein